MTGPHGGGRCLLFVESNTTGSGMRAIQRALAMGLRPALLTSNPDRYAGLANTGAEVLLGETNTLPGLVDAINRIEGGRLAGVTTTSEFYAELTARLAAILDLPGNPPDAVAACRRKDRTRTMLRAAGLLTPAFAVVRHEEQVAAAVAAVGLPCVVKPSADTGSCNVLWCASVAQALAQCQIILRDHTNVRGQLSPATALIEQYIAGDEYSVEMISRQQRTSCVGVTGKLVTGKPHFVESGHVFPAPLTGPRRATIEATAAAGLAAVGITDGVTHTEIRLGPDGPVIIEINARPAGGMIPEMISLAGGGDLLGAQIRCAVGQPPAEFPDPHRAGAIAFLLAERDGRLRSVLGVADALALPGVEEVTVTARHGSWVRRPHDAYDRAGFVLGHGVDAAHAEETVHAGRDLVRLVLDEER